MIENLTPWRPGQSGNPGGRPKKSPVTDHVREQLDKPIPEAMRGKLPPIFTEIYGPDATFGQMIAFKLIASSAKGDIFAMKELLDRVEGKVSQSHKLAGEDGGPIQFTVTRAGSKER
jgi:hypothetical protein